MKRNVAVVGAGYWGANLIRTFHGLEVLHSVCDTRDSARAEVLKKFPGTQCYADYSQVLSDSEIDAVVLSTPAVTHFRMACRALEAGKDVYSEKPCGLTIAYCQQLADTMKRTGRIFQAGTQRRSVPNFQQAAMLAHGGKLGGTNCVAWMFDRKAVFVVSAAKVDEEKLMEVVLEAGADPALVTEWMKETQAQRSAAKVKLDRSDQPTRRMSKDDIMAIVDALGNIADVLRDAVPEDKIEVYSGLGLRLRYQPVENTVRAEVSLDPRHAINHSRGEMVRVRGGT